MRSRLTLASLVALAVPWGCEGPRGPVGPTGVPCTVTTGVDGTRSITCADGTVATLADGADGMPCSVVDNGDSTKTITCGDGTVTTIADGASCSVSENGDGTKTIACADGTRVAVSDGADGGACSVRDNGDGTKTITCADGTRVTVSDGRPSPVVDTSLGRRDDLPGLELTILGLAGQTHPSGSFRVGDYVEVTFTVSRRGGAPLPLAEIDATSLWVSGPTTNFQRVIPAGRTSTSLADVKDLAVENGDGSYTYILPDPIPSKYGPPLYDTAKFTDGELTDEALSPGTYRIAMVFRKNYSIEGAPIRDVGWAIADFAIGGALPIEAREVVTTDNCNQCHVELRMHGGTYRDTRLCVTCHTSGAEDRESTDVEDPTPVTIDFRVLIHKLHNGAHLPSVLGVATLPSGARTYEATPARYEVGGIRRNDYSEVAFPVFPNLSIPMPRDLGYGALSAAEKAIDDEIRRGVTACEKCHGDPDGGGPLPPPSQGSLAYEAPSRRACGSCHDDINWSYAYRQNTLSGMGPQPNDVNCTVCHAPADLSVGGSVRDSHRHPIYDGTLNPGLRVERLSVNEAGAHDADGTIDPGEKIQITFSLTDDAGQDIAPSVAGALSVVIAGPRSNRNLVLNTSIPAAALGGPQPSHTTNVPHLVALERLGAASGGAQMLMTRLTPIWTSAATVYERTAYAAETSLDGRAGAMQTYVDVASAAGFTRGAPLGTVIDAVVVDEGTPFEEYVRVQYAEGDRLWLTSPYAQGTYGPWLRFDHTAGASVRLVTLARKTSGADFSIADAATGQIALVDGRFGAGNPVLASYTSDFVVPEVYGPALNDSPDLDETWGEWSGMPIASGTYTVGVWGSRSVTLGLHGETNTYRGTSRPATADFLVGSAAAIEPFAIISSGESCNACHGDLMFHGGSRRGFDTCVLCHGTAGAEDRPRYVAAGAPATTGVTINFRTMLHKIHAGGGLSEAAAYTVNGFGGGGYPNNFTAHGYAGIRFPAMPDGVKRCDTCHGSSAAWQSPADRTHADRDAQAMPTRAWMTACGSCHDSDAAVAHVDSMTSARGKEACATCHGAGRDQDVVLVHETR